MRKMKWPVAAALMEKWFAGPPSNDRTAQTPDTTNVTVDWTLTSPPVAKVYQQYLQDRVWLTPNARMEIIVQLRQKGMKLATAPTPFGNLSASVLLLNKVYIQSKQYTSSPWSDPLNDVYGALGSFNYHYAVEGVVTPSPKGQFRIAIKKVGIFVFDKYDFEDDASWWRPSQPLGFWNFDTGDVSKGWSWGYHEVSNSTFRDWRAKNGHGGDFLVYSKVKIIELFPPQVFMASL